MSDFGTVAISGHEWLDERAQRVLNRGIPPLPELPAELQDDRDIESPEKSGDQQEECHDGDQGQ